MAVKAFDLAERFQTPVFVLTDLDIGMNDWMVPKLDLGRRLSARPRQGAVAAELEKAQNFYRYLDVDGDGIPYRTLPGVHPKGAFFTRGSGHNKLGGYTEDADEYQEVIDRIARKIQSAAHRPCRRRSSRTTPGAQARPHHRRRLPRRRASRRSTCWRKRRHRARLPARARLPVRRRGARRSSTRTSVDVRRRAEPRRAAARPCCMLETGRVARRSSMSVRYYGGFPMSAHHVIAGVEGQKLREGGIMTYIAKPKVHHPSLQKNALGLTRRDYEGSMSTLCAGCGHDSVTAAIIQAFWELDIAPHTVAKLSGIGCSSKTPTYFLQRGARLQQRARPHAGDRHRRQRRQRRRSSTSASRATATRCRSASASCATPSAAT